VAVFIHPVLFYLQRLGPIVKDFDFDLEGGTLDGHGVLEYSPWQRSLDLADLVVTGLHVDWRLGQTSADQAVEAVEALDEEEAMEVRLERLELVDSEIGVIVTEASPQYRLFLGDADVVINGYSNLDGAPPMGLEARGLFQGSGPSRIAGAFRSDDAGPDFDLDVRIENTQLASLNDMLRANFNVDVTRGTFAFYSEIAAQNGRIDGYVKPMFVDAEIYDPAQDRDDGFFRRMWERIAEGLAKLLENKRRDQVATVADISGKVEDVRASNAQVVVNLIRNAFFQAILPGFRRDIDEGRIATAKPEKKKRESNERSGG
jgi:hypothetical protein